MLSRDRRLGFRVPIEIFLNQFIRDRPFRALSANISDTGIYLHTPERRTKSRSFTPTPVTLEFTLPGSEEVIWAAGEICSNEVDGMVSHTGVRFTAMASVHARLIRDYCVESRRSQLGTLLQRIRGATAAA
jgi:c-di-GMP-binding flagellar brake protein YcgR